jgi:hypothetical protein
MVLGFGWMLAATERALACATCFGVSDSKLAQGMNWGILSLLVVVGSVLLGIAVFFAFIIRRGARLADLPEEVPVGADAGVEQPELVETLR